MRPGTIVPPLQLPLNDSAYDSPLLPKQNRQKCGQILQDALKKSQPLNDEAAPPNHDIANDESVL